ncbi:MAG: restriction endonuclease subunit S [Candidatus Electrothrix sp. AR3]|nr:restriction endonuclease subunit S [Candidatus Electrothrix sp. AR3]
MRYGVYSAYRDSGVEWLGAVPEHWESRRLGAYGAFQGGTGFPHEIQGKKRLKYPFYKVSDTNLDGNEIYLSIANNYISQETANKISAKINKSGSIMFPKVGAALLGNKRRILSVESIVDNNCMVFSPYKGDIKYWYYWLSELDFGQISNPGPVPSVNESQLTNFPSIFPPVEEQTAIANFLDRETSKIDQLISKQQQLIALLKEKRQAVISHAVTKGLDPEAKMKDSGVEWLGEVPAHWVVKNYRYSTKIYRGKFGHRPRNDPEYYDGEYPFIQTGDIARAGKVITSYKQTLNEKGISVSQKFSAGTLVMAIAANIGDIATLNFEAYAPDSVVGFKPKPDCDLEFLRCSLMGALPVLEQSSTQNAQANLNIDRIGSVSAAFPPLHEQIKISSEIDQLMRKTDILIEKATKAIALLKERRTALISAAVTGKIDVRTE